MRHRGWLLAGICLLVAGGASAQVQSIEAGPIWNDADARGKCPAACSSAGGQAWTGNWRTTVPNRMSVCDCESVGASGASPAGGSAELARYNGTDFKANDLPGTGAPARSYEECAGRCLADGRCVAFTLNTYTTSCYLKSAVGKARRADHAMSGILGSRAALLPGASGPVAGGGACSIGGTPKCPGCSVSCPPGQSPVCNPAVEGVTSFCARNASCRCM